MRSSDAPGDLQEHTALDERLEALGSPLEARVELRMGEQHAEPAVGERVEGDLEGRGERPVRRLDEQVGAAVAVGREAQLLVRRALSPQQVDLAAGL